MCSFLFGAEHTQINLLPFWYRMPVKSGLTMKDTVMFKMCCVQHSFTAISLHGCCGHDLGVDRVHNTWPKFSKMKYFVTFLVFNSLFIVSFLIWS